MRPKKHTVDYFPHQCKHGKTMQILKSKFRNDGKAFWFTLLEILGQSEDHYYDCKNAFDWEFLLSETDVTEKTAIEILNTLSKLDAIDKELWDKKIIWSQNFVDNLSELYARRNTNIPQKPETPVSGVNVNNNPVNVCRNPQSKVKKSKEEKNKEKILHLDFIYLTKDEYEKLIKRFGGQTTKKMIDSANSYAQQIGIVKFKAKYKSHYHTILNWTRRDNIPEIKQQEEKKSETKHFEGRVP